MPPPGLTKSVNAAPVKPRRPPPVDAAAPDPPAVQARVEAAVADYLSKRPGRSEMMTKLGVFLRGKALAPGEGLKKFLLKRKDKFHCYDDG